jgi:lipopolysaccharide export system permease protein
MGRVFHPLDRYIFSEFWRIFVSFALGLPILLVIIDLTENLGKFLDRQLPRADIALSYLYWLPESAFMALPAAVLFGTVFTVGSITRHSEITAAKASGISFYRLIVPIFVGAVLATGLGLVLSELIPVTNSRRLELLREQDFQRGDQRYNFTYAAEGGRVYKIAALDVKQGRIANVQIERKGSGPAYPTLITVADTGRHHDGRGWVIGPGYMHIIPDSTTDHAFRFEGFIDRHMTELPRDLTARDKAPADMGFRELGRYIAAMERSGADANVARVERMLKITIPATCLIIVLIGAPLATSTQRGGAAWGIGVSLGVTVVFLMLIQLTKAIGSKGVIPPELAAWLPSAAFAIAGTILLWRVRT